MKIKNKIVFSIIIILIFLFIIHILFYNNFELFISSDPTIKRSDPVNFNNLIDINNLQYLITDLTMNINNLYINNTTDPNYIILNSHILEIQSAMNYLKYYCNDFGDCHNLQKSDIIHMHKLIWPGPSNNEDCLLIFIDKLHNNNIISEESYNNIIIILNKIGDSLSKLLLDNNFLIPTTNSTNPNNPTTTPTPTSTPKTKYIQYAILDYKNIN